MHCPKRLHANEQYKDVKLKKNAMIQDMGDFGADSY